MYEQFQNIMKMGPFGQIMGMIPGFSQVQQKYNGVPKDSTKHSQFLLFFWPISLNIFKLRSKTVKGILKLTYRAMHPGNTISFDHSG